MGCLWLGLAVRKGLDPRSLGPPPGCRVSGRGGGECSLSEEIGIGRRVGASRVASVSPGPHGFLLSVKSVGHSGVANWVQTLDNAVCFRAAEAASLHAVCCVLQTAVLWRLFFVLEFSHLEARNQLVLCWDLLAPWERSLAAEFCWLRKRACVLIVRPGSGQPGLGGTAGSWES